MKILLIGFGKVNKMIFEEVKDKVVGIICETQEKILDIPDIIIDFSHPSSLDKVIQLSKKYDAKLIVGTTGYNNEKMAQIKELSNYIGVLKSENFSKGISIIKKILISHKNELDTYKKTIIERHNANKKDAPSGTALALGEIIETSNIISFRESDIIGEHSIIFEDENERIIIIHEALNRGLFINAVLKCATWLLKQKPGLYSLEDVVND